MKASSVSFSDFTANFLVSCKEAYNALFNSLSSRHDSPAVKSRFLGDIFLRSLWARLGSPEDFLEDPPVGVGGFFPTMMLEVKLSQD